MHNLIRNDSLHSLNSSISNRNGDGDADRIEGRTFSKVVENAARYAGMSK
jgi:hypothetical protein